MIHTFTITQEQMDRLHGAAHSGGLLGGQAAYEACLKVEAILSEIAFKEGFDKSPGSAPEDLPGVAQRPLSCPQMAVGEQWCVWPKCDCQPPVLATIERMIEAAIAHDDFVNGHTALEILDVIRAAQPPAAPVETERRCQKCWCATNGEEAIVDGQVWCHPCADADLPTAQDVRGILPPQSSAETSGQEG